MKKGLFGLTLLTIIVYYHKLLFTLSIGGDTYYIYPSMLGNFTFLPYAWGWSGGNGFGEYAAPFIANHALTFFISLLGNTFSLSWESIIKIAFLLPFFLLAFSGSWLLARNILGDKSFALLSALIFILNSYILMVLSGGQFVVAIAYAMLPLVFLLFLQFIRAPYLKSAIYCSFAYSFLVMMDIRIAYLAAVGLAILYTYLIATKSIIQRRHWKSIIGYTLLIIVFTLLLQAFWLLPTVLKQTNPLTSLGSAYTTQQAVSFFSFAYLENSLSLLHPNWPENIFGKVYFMRPEFLLVPLLAFSALLFVRKREKEQRTMITYFALLAILGAFLAKGAREPFGDFYLWLFDTVPGFIMFRDPTKWYMLIALSYSVLIPFTLLNFSKLLVKRFNKVVSLIIVSVLIGSLFFLVRPAILQELTGTFKTATVDQDYVKLATFLDSQNTFFRTMWMPTHSLYSYTSPMHPSVSAQQYFVTYSVANLPQKLRDRLLIKALGEESIKYIIVPYDQDGKIFVKDRKYDEKQYLQVISEMNNVPLVKKIDGFGKIHVYEIEGYKDHLWSSAKNLTITYEYNNPTSYLVSLANAKKGDVVIFTENYDNGWIMANKNEQAQRELYKKRFISFILPRDGTYQMNLTYQPQKLIIIGGVISLISIVVLVGLLLYSKSIHVKKSGINGII